MCEMPDNDVLAIEPRMLGPARTVVLTLNRPDKRNCLNERLLLTLSDAVARHSGETALITGAGRAFCSGIDLAFLRQAMSRDGSGVGPLGLLRNLYETLRMHPRPTVALVNGPAVGGGVGVAAACDLVLATADATFKLPGGDYAPLAGVVVPLLNARTGFAVPQGGSWLGPTIGVEDAHALGLVDRIIDRGAGLTRDVANRAFEEHGLADKPPNLPRHGAALTAALDAAFRIAGETRLS